MTLSTISKQVFQALKKHSPAILTGVGVVGLLATTGLAVEVTPKALTLIEEKKQERGVEKLTVAETVQTVWKCYIPAAVTAAASVACIVGASKVSASRNAALATAYTLSETAAREYKDKVIETIGEKKEQEVRDAIAKDKIDKVPVSGNEVVVTEKGNTLCFDPWSSRYFKSDIEKLRKAANDLNYQLLNDGAVTLNDFYYEIGLSDTKVGSYIGWDLNGRRRSLELRFSSQIAEDGTPCLVLGFVDEPTYC